MIKKLTIDRFEGDLAVCETEDEDYVDIPRSQLPEEAAEGSIISELGGVYKLERDETAARRAAIAQKMRALFDKD